LVKKTFPLTRSSRKLPADKAAVTVVLGAKAGVIAAVTVVAVAEVKEVILPAGTAKTMQDRGGITILAAVETGAAEDNCKLISKEIKDVTAEKDRI
jgi:hypothetical protein